MDIINGIIDETFPKNGSLQGKSTTAMNIWFTNEHEKTTNLNELNELRQREFVSVRTQFVVYFFIQEHRALTISPV